jgi:exopolysaccharide biosynthesis polyprenyl glycosylphosphotransferase
LNAADQQALTHAPAFYDQIAGGLDARTLEALDRRRRATVRIKDRGWLLRRMLALADVTGIAVAFLIAEAVTGDGGGIAGASAEYVLFFATLPAWVVVAKLYGLYDRDQRRNGYSTVDDIPSVFHMVTSGAWVFFFAAHLSGVAQPNLSKVGTFWGTAIGLVLLGRASARALSHRSAKFLQNAVIVGAGDVGQEVARKLQRHPEYGINLIGFVDREPKEQGPALEHVAHLGPPERLPTIVRLFDVERVVIAFSKERHEETIELIRTLKDLDVYLDIVPRMFDIVGPGAEIHTLEGVSLVGLPPFGLSRSSRFLKRALDFGASLAALVVLAPLFGLIALLIKLDSPGPIFFRQVRQGAKGRTFTLYKDRTMVADADARKAEFAHLNKYAQIGGDPRKFKIENDPRVTRVGRLLRRWLLDELPQLLNVLEGHMSLVGPRPLILEEDQYVESWARKRLDLKPGMTGVWQVLGRNAISFEEMVRLDYLYVTNWSLWNDCRLLLRTCPLVLRGDGGVY